MANLGWYGIDCDNSSWAWIDPGCIVQAAGSGVGIAIDKATAPIRSEVNLILISILVAIVLVVLIIAFSPNVKHIVPHFV
jgi:hypothetical protein